jgi:signal transduction histidine kinase
LGIVKGLVEAHGGKTWVESSVGLGSTFFFSVPRATQRSAWANGGADRPDA